MVVRGPPPSPDSDTLKTHHPLPSSGSTATVKFLCSYGGRIVPRPPDGRLRYVGGDTRLLSFPRSISFSELLLKTVELCGRVVSLRCQLPTEDLDALVSITCDEDLANLIDEYDRAAVPKIRAFLFLPKLSKPVSPPFSPASLLSSSGATACSSSSYAFAKPVAADRCLHQLIDSRPKQPFLSPALCLEKAAGKTLNQQLHVYASYTICSFDSIIKWESTIMSHPLLMYTYSVEKVKHGEEVKQKVQCSMGMIRGCLNRVFFRWVDHSAKGQRLVVGEKG